MSPVAPVTTATALEPEVVQHLGFPDDGVYVVGNDAIPREISVGCQRSGSGPAARSGRRRITASMAMAPSSQRWPLRCSSGCPTRTRCARWHRLRCRARWVDRTPQGRGWRRPAPGTPCRRRERASAERGVGAHHPDLHLRWPVEAQQLLDRRHHNSGRARSLANWSGWRRRAKVPLAMRLVVARGRRRA